MNRVLSKSEILDIVSNVDTKLKVPRWPNEKDKKLILKAAQSKSTSVELSTGSFDIRYSDGIPYKYIQGIHSTIFVVKVGEGIPCGWFDEKTLTNEVGE